MTLIEVGPVHVRGPGLVSENLAAAALECVDDVLALVEDRPVPVTELWRDVLRSAVGGSVEPVVLLVPGWWPATRSDLVLDAARDIVADAVVVSRPEALYPAVHATVVEVAPGCVALYRNGITIRVVPRGVEIDVVADVAAACAGSNSVLIDDSAADGTVVAALAGRLRSAGSDVTFAVPQPVDATVEMPAPASPPRIRARRAFSPDRRVGAVLAGAAVCGLTLTVGIAGDIAGGTAIDESTTQETATTLLVEGRVGVRLPALWQVRRVRTGPGSTRVEAVSPDDPHAVLHLTQSPRPAGQTAQEAAAALLGALDEQPPGVFDEFEPDDRVAGRAAITYRETRAGHRIAWVIILDGAVRIAVGCQAPPAREHDVRETCDTAVRSAHTVY